MKLTTGHFHIYLLALINFDKNLWSTTSTLIGAREWTLNTCLTLPIQQFSTKFDEMLEPGKE